MLRYVLLFVVCVFYYVLYVLLYVFWCVLFCFCYIYIVERIRRTTAAFGGENLGPVLPGSENTFLEKTPIAWTSMGLLGLLQIFPGCGEFEFTSGDLYIIAEIVSRTNLHRTQ